MDPTQMLLKNTQELIDYAKNIAPQVWMMAVHRVQAAVWTRISVAAFGIVICTTLLWFLIPYWAEHDNEMKDQDKIDWLWWSRIICVIINVCILLGISDIVALLVAPDYEALKVLMNLAK